MERNNKYDKYFSKDMTPKQVDIIFFKLMKNVPQEDVEEFFDAWNYVSYVIYKKRIADPNMMW